MQRRSNHLKKTRKLPYIILGAVAAVLVLIYAGGAIHYSTSNTFMPNTVIDGVNVAGKNVNQAQTLVNNHVKNQTFNLTEKNKVLKTAKYADAGLTSSDNKTIAKLLNKQNALMWPLQLVHAANADNTVNATSKAKLEGFAKKTAITLNKNRNTGSASAISATELASSSSKKDNKIISSTALAEEIKTSIAKGQKDIDLTKTYQSATVNSDDIQKQIKKYTAEKITYNINGTNVTIPSDTLKQWIVLTSKNDGTQTVSVDNAQVKAYLDDLNDKYSTYGASVTFNSTKRGSQTVKNEIFGWTIDTTTDAADIAQKIATGKDFTEKATISGSGQSLKKGELGSTYVEVDKTNQHMWYYKDGKLKISTDVVTGMPANNDDTPTGVFFVWNKKRNATLKGKNTDGSNYASPVSYWMPIDYTGVGLHDASWQPKFGGDWYKTHGSHGCVNTPPATMKTVYAEVALGTPVVVF